MEDTAKVNNAIRLIILTRLVNDQCEYRLVSGSPLYGTSVGISVSGSSSDMKLLVLIKRELFF